MPQVKILRAYENAEKWKPGDIVDISDPKKLIEEGKVSLVDEGGHLVSQDESEARHFIEKLGSEEAANLAFDILRKLGLLDALTKRPATIVKEEKKEEEKKEDEKKKEVVSGKFEGLATPLNMRAPEPKKPVYKKV